LLFVDDLIPTRCVRFEGDSDCPFKRGAHRTIDSLCPSLPSHLLRLFPPSVLRDKEIFVLMGGLPAHVVQSKAFSPPTCAWFLRNAAFPPPLLADLVLISRFRIGFSNGRFVQEPGFTFSGDLCFPYSSPKNFGVFFFHRDSVQFSLIILLLCHRFSSSFSRLGCRWGLYVDERQIFPLPCLCDGWHLVTLSPPLGVSLGSFLPSMNFFLPATRSFPRRVFGDRQSDPLFPPSPQAIRADDYHFFPWC